MKKLFAIYTLLCLWMVSEAQDTYYYCYDKKIPVSEFNDMIYIKLTEDFIKDKLQNIKKEYSIRYYDEVKKEIVIKGNNICSKIQDLTQDKDVISLSPFYSTMDGKYKMGAVESFVVRLKSFSDISLLKKIVSETKTSIVEYDNWDTKRVIIAVDKYSKGNTLQMANYFYDLGIFEYSVPNFIGNISLETNDEFWEEQWTLENSGQYGGSVGADININSAWQITKGDNVKTAVLDVGIDLTHPDLINNLLPGYDATGNGSAGASTNGESHGTSCAGIIAAQANNTIGISGVAPNSKIIPVRMALDEYNCSSYNVVNAIRWAWQNGADIINFSWGIAPNPDIMAEIDNATTYGRNGLGCILLCASGNDYQGRLDFPACLPRTIAVGASSNKDYRESYSNYGVGLDVVAPGGYYNITTTDYRGSMGYDQGDYVHTFCGTSAACPHAAGVVALMLAVNPCMTSMEVRIRLCKSCNKIRSSGYVYNNMEYGLWNEQVGYGRINAYKAVLLSLENPYKDSVEVNQIYDSTHYEGVWIPIFSGITVPELNQHETYYVKVFEAIKTITFPYVENPIINISTNGLSNLYQDNRCYIVSNITRTSADIKIWKYKVLCKNSDYNPFHMNPLNLINLYVPEDLWVSYEIFDALTPIVYITNKTINNTTYSRTAIEQLSTTNFFISGDSNVNLRAGEEIVFNATTSIKPIGNGVVCAKVEPMVHCETQPNRVQEDVDYATQYQKKDFIVNDRDNLDSISIEDTFSPIILYPNPAKGELHIRINEDVQDEELQIVITNISGRTIDLIRTNSVDVIVDVLNYTTGSYIVCVKNGDRFYRELFIKN